MLDGLGRPGFIAGSDGVLPMSNSLPPGARGQISADVLAMMRYDAAKKSLLVAYLLWFFIGFAGIHRFYLGATGSGIAMLVIFLVSIPLALVAVGLLGFLVLGIWWLVDGLLIPGMAERHNTQLIQTLRV
jgi:TM2 domain-containing membrane protein YozV